MRYFIIICFFAFFNCTEQAKPVFNGNQQSFFNDNILEYAKLIDTLHSVCRQKVLFEIDSVRVDVEGVSRSRIRYLNALQSIYAQKEMYVSSIDYYLSKGIVDTTIALEFMYVPPQQSVMPQCYFLNDRQLLHTFRKAILNESRYLRDCVR